MQRLIACTLLIFAVTLFPYDFASSSSGLPAAVDSFRLGPLHTDWSDLLINLLLFMPFGALAQQLRPFGSLTRTVLIGGVLGCGVSLAAEVLQSFVPSRNPSVVDVLVNSAGAMGGALAFHAWGSRAVDGLARLRSQHAWFYAALMVAFAGTGLGVSAALQVRTQLSNWDPNYPLLVGNERTGDRPWRGRMFSFELTDAATPFESIRAVADGNALSIPGERLARFQFGGTPPFQDAAGQGPDLTWMGASGDDSTRGVRIVRGSWLQSEGPAAHVADRLRETSAFTLRVLCATDDPDQSGPARIVSNSLDTKNRNFTLGQEGTNLVFRFRSPHTGVNGLRPEVVIKDVFAGIEPKEIVITYDGATLLAAVKGSNLISRTELNPGSSLATTASARQVQAAHVRVYQYAYVAILFALGAALASLVKRRPWWPSVGTLGVVAFAILLESTLVLTSGRSFHTWNVIGNATIGALFVTAFASPMPGALQPVNWLGASPVQSSASAPGTFRIQATVGLASLNLRELWARRELVYFLMWRDIKVRYKQTVLGAAWAVLQPVMTMAVFAVFFGRLARMPSDGVPYALFAYAGLLPWMFFANGVSQAANSVVHHANLLTKVYFPRLIIPIATVLSGLLDFAFAFSVLLGLMVYFGVAPTMQLLSLPLFMLLAVVTALGVSLWLSALNVQFRDVRYTVSFLMQFWMFATPVAYPSSLLPEPWRLLYGLNPMAGVVEGFRWALLGLPQLSGLVWVSAAVAIVLLVSGAFYFRHVERTFADIV
ncbi:MAG: ABC transporter permease [Vicinamibacterales bacterium]